MIHLRKRFAQLMADRGGAAALEFAIVAPVFFALLFGIVQLGILFQAQSGLRNSVEDAARFATTWPKPTTSAIQMRITNNGFGLNPANIGTPSIVFSTGASPNYVTISMTYNISVNYVLGTQNLTLSESRKAFTVS